MRRKQKNNLKRVAISSSVAAAAGYLAGILTAPKSGKQTRKDLEKAADKGRANAEKDLKQLNKELTEAIKQAKSDTKKKSAKAKKDLDEMAEKALNTKEKVRQIISAIHDGDAADEELNRAIKNAKTAIEDIKEYLKKA